MTPETFAHIREDVRNAMVENRNDDPALMPELVIYLLDQLGEVATNPFEVFRRWSLDESVTRAPVQIWTERLLERCQLRAISQIPMADADACDQADDPYDPDWRDHA